MALHTSLLQMYLFHVARLPTQPPPKSRKISQHVDMWQNVSNIAIGNFQRKPMERSYLMHEAMACTAGIQINHMP